MALAATSLLVVAPSSAATNGVAGAGAGTDGGSQLLGGLHDGPPGDFDGDGTPNNDDRDMDGDGKPNYLDFDVDGDGKIDNWPPYWPEWAELDDDRDGIPNGKDARWWQPDPGYHGEPGAEWGYVYDPLGAPLDSYLQNYRALIGDE